MWSRIPSNPSSRDEKIGRDLTESKNALARMAALEMGKPVNAGIAEIKSLPQCATIMPITAKFLQDGLLEPMLVSFLPLLATLGGKAPELFIYKCSAFWLLPFW